MDGLATRASSTIGSSNRDKRYLHARFPRRVVRLSTEFTGPRVLNDETVYHAASPHAIEASAVPRRASLNRQSFRIRQFVPLRAH
jgi:hypothetical protein